jgi:hypothetical protein
MHERQKCCFLGLVAAAGLSLIACAPIDATSVDPAPDRPMYPSAARRGTAASSDALAAARPERSQPDHQVSASIQTPSGKRVWMAAKADRAATNAWLARRGERFVAANPDDMPNPYWGLDPAANAYIFLDVTQYSDSHWELAGVQRQGPYAVFDLTVYGFQTDAHGAPIDITGDGVVDDNDWTGLEMHTTLSGVNPGDTETLVEIERILFGARVDGRAVAVEAVDAEGYPNRARSGEGSEQITLAVGAENPNRCAPEAVEWERCWYWGDIATPVLTAFPAPRSLVRTWSGTNNVPNWVKFDAATDTFHVGDRRLAAQLDAIGFAPLFWIRSRDFSASFASPPR